MILRFCDSCDSKNCWHQNISIYFILYLRSCDSATPAIPKIVSKKNISIHFYCICDPAILRLLRFQKKLAKIYFNSSKLNQWSCDSATPAIPKIVSTKIFQLLYIGSVILRFCDSATPAIPKIVSKKNISIHLYCICDSATPAIPKIHLYSFILNQISWDSVQKWFA